MLKKIILFICISLFSINSEAGMLGDACVIDSSGNGKNTFDSSDCDQGLQCDKKVKVCIDLTQTACRGGETSASGMVCMSIRDTDKRAVNGAPGIWAVGDASVEKNAFSGMLCNALKIATGGAGKAVCAFAIISVAVGFFVGKITWGSCAAVCLGCACLFGAPTMVSIISGSGKLDCLANK